MGTYSVLSVFRLRASALAMCKLHSPFQVVEVKVVIDLSTVNSAGLVMEDVGDRWSAGHHRGSIPNNITKLRVYSQSFVSVFFCTHVCMVCVCAENSKVF